MATWTRCDTCRKVKQSDEFDADSTVCRACLTAPVKVARTRASDVTTTRKAPRAPRSAPAVAEVGPRPALMGVAGSGDLEVRERRARRVALDQLAETHPEDFAQLLHVARSAEGLRT